MRGVFRSVRFRFSPSRRRKRCSRQKEHMQGHKFKAEPGTFQRPTGTWHEAEAGSPHHKGPLCQAEDSHMPTLRLQPEIQKIISAPRTSEQ